MENDWVVSIKDDGPTWFKNVWIYKRRGDGRVDVLETGDVVTTHEHNTAIPIKPTFRLEPEMLRAFAEALSQEKIEPRATSKTEGMYEAQSEHLKDLRKLLKL